MMSPKTKYQVRDAVKIVHITDDILRRAQITERRVGQRHTRFPETPLEVGVVAVGKGTGVGVAQVDQFRF